MSRSSPRPERAPREARPTEIETRLLRAWPLPQPDEAGSKETRGRVLCVGGTAELPGAILLAATAALRAGAGKLQIAVPRSMALSVGITIPEARVFALPETDDGSIAPEAANLLVPWAKLARAVLIGPGVVDEAAMEQLMAALLPELDDQVVVVDVAAMQGMVAAIEHGRAASLKGQVIFTPHAGEMASLLRCDLEEVSARPSEVASEAAATWQAVVALKGAETFVASPDGRTFHFAGGTVGLATSGSGDTLSGIIAGLAARGAPPEQAAAWGVYLHGTAGVRLARKMGRLGFLARELLAEIPPLMAKLETSDVRPQKSAPRKRRE